MVDFDRVRSRYTVALDEQALWLDQLEDFEQNYSIAGSKAIAVADFLTVGLSVTADTLQLAMNLSGVPSTPAGYIHTTEVVTDVALSDSVEEASYRLVAEKSGVFKNALSSYDIIKGLLDAKERFKDHNETIKLLQKNSKKLRTNLAKSRQGLDNSKSQLKDLNDYKNYMDGLCNNPPASDNNWVYVGFRIADYVGPPKSYNKIPTKYGAIWLKKDNQYRNNKEQLKKRLKKQYPGTYLDYKFASPESYNFVALYKVKVRVGTWDSVELEVDQYKFYSGKSKEAIEKRLRKDATDYKYKSTQLVELIDIKEKQKELRWQPNSIYEQVMPRSLSGNNDRNENKAD